MGNFREESFFMAPYLYTFKVKEKTGAKKDKKCGPAPLSYWDTFSSSYSYHM